MEPSVADGIHSVNFSNITSPISGSRIQLIQVKDLFGIALPGGFSLQPDAMFKSLSASSDVGTPQVTSEDTERLESRLESRRESRLAAKALVILDGGENGKAGLAKIFGHKTVSGEINKQVNRWLRPITCTISLLMQGSNHVPRGCVVEFAQALETFYWPDYKTGSHLYCRIGCPQGLNTARVIP